MPAPITHYLFAERVLCLLKKRGICISVPDMYFIGTQGPDIFFFHRVFPWERGKSHASVGRLLHRTSPALLFEGFCNVLDCQTDNYNAMLCYVLGFFCHYALDRTTHPFIYCSQSRLSADDPGYGTHPHQYHFRIESALDTIMLRRQTGRMIKNFNLLNVLPHAESSKYALIGYMYHKILLILYGLDIPPELLAYAPADMRHALFFMDDRTLLRRKLVLRPMEKLLRQGHMVTSLLRPNNTSEWDYANTSHKMWTNPCDRSKTSTDSFVDLYDSASNQACDMICEFLYATTFRKPMTDITQDRGFSSDLPGVYCQSFQNGNKT